MISWFKKKDDAPTSQRLVLQHAVKRAMGGADEDGVRIVSAIAALLLCVAYADKDYAASEEAMLRETLSRVHGLDATGVDAIAEVLREHVVTITSAEATGYARELLELTAADFRHELLDMLVDLAAADDEITVTETNLLRVVVPALGLSQQDYTASQKRHRDKLAVLNPAARKAKK
jgi:uncharacterized tellurite resistance protein B-like protein